MSGIGVRWPKSGATRLSAHDYKSPGAYFVTICAHQRLMLFDRPAIVDVIECAWQAIPGHFSGISVDAFVVMPNHVHGIVLITNERAESVVPQHAGALRQTASLSTVIRSFKAAVTRELRMQGLHDGRPLWQPNYYDRVIRNEGELGRIREYIDQNPLGWAFDHENPQRTADEGYERNWEWLEGV